VSVAEVAELARKRLPGPIYDFITAGTGTEITLKRNVRDFDKFSLQPRVGIDVSQTDMSTTVFGQRVSFPLIIAPAGGFSMADPSAECAVAAAASKAGLMYGLSIFSTDSVEAVASAGEGPRLFQLYFLKDPFIVGEMIEAVRAARYNALCVTLDVPVTPVRDRVDRWHSFRPRPPMRTVIEMLKHPGWLMRKRRLGKRPLADVARRITEGGRTLAPDFYTAGIRADVGWDEIEAVAKKWNGPFAVKGVMCAQDALRAENAGATAVIVCNHGGIGLDGAPSTLSVIPEIVDAVGGRLEVIQNGGVRRGEGIVKSLALGATAAMTARPFFFGLAAAGQAGVSHVIEILRKDFEIAMKLCGCKSVGDIGPQVLRNSALRRHAASTE